jgi:hypothetical protein
MPSLPVMVIAFVLALASTTSDIPVVVESTAEENERLEKSSAVSEEDTLAVSVPPALAADALIA